MAPRLARMYLASSIAEINAMCNDARPKVECKLISVNLRKLRSRSRVEHLQFNQGRSKALKRPAHLDDAVICGGIFREVRAR